MIDTTHENRSQKTINAVILTLLAGAVVYGAIEVVRLSWVCDDAFISFRYAKNLVNGLGLVFNAGERVEGYTNFLWTVMIAGGMLIKLDPVLLSEVLGGLSFFATAGIFAFLSLKLFVDDRRHLYIPITALALLVHHESHIFATSGLETMWTTMLVSLGFALLILGRSARILLTASIVLIAAAMSRPDAMIFYAVSIVYVAVTSRPLVRSLGLYLLPLAVIYLPYWFARYSYYGFPFPNTYYAKSADLPYYSQGLIYLWLYLKSYYILMLTPLALIAGAAAKLNALTRFPIESPRARTLLLSVFFCFPFIWYVARSGGDFMFGRFLIPITPILFFVIETAVRELFVRWRYVIPVAALVVVAVFFRIDLYQTERQISFVADEPAYYPASWHERGVEIGGRMREYFRGTDAAIAFRGQFAVYAYYSEVPVAIEAATGLTDPFIAHQPLSQRGRPAHEKPAPQSYLEKRGVSFKFQGGVIPSDYTDSLVMIDFGGFPSYIVTFNNSLMDRLEQFPEIRFTDIRPIIDSTIVRLPDAPPELINNWFMFLTAYYFDHNDDPGRRQPFIDAMSRTR